MEFQVWGSTSRGTERKEEDVSGQRKKMGGFLSSVSKNAIHSPQAEIVIHRQQSRSATNDREEAVGMGHSEVKSRPGSFLPQIE